MSSWLADEQVVENAVQARSHEGRSVTRGFDHVLERTKLIGPPSGLCARLYESSGS